MFSIAIVSGKILIIAAYHAKQILLKLHAKYIGSGQNYIMYNIFHVTLERKCVIFGT